ncbi:MAG: L,D-transpeptidase family protein [Thermomicrobiales bacterium]
MRVIAAGLAVFLVVTGILFFQVSSGHSDAVAIAVVASPESTSTTTLSSSPSPTQAAQPTLAVPTATMMIAPPIATATPAPVDPTAPPIVTEVVVEEPEVVATEAVDVESVVEVPVIEPVIEPEIVDEDDSVAALAAVGVSDAWSGAIMTPNGGLIGMVMSGLANVRALPAVDAEVIEELQAGWPVAIYGVSAGDAVSETDIWYQVSGGYVSAALVQPFVPREPATYYSGHWVDVDLTGNVAVAYIDDIPVNAVVIISGKPGFETPIGEHTIFARVESETLDSATVGTPQGDPEYYYLPDVPHTQYFAAGGFAIHANYWSDPWEFGSATSHGCVNMLEEDAAWFWSFLDIGSIVSVGY